MAHLPPPEEGLDMGLIAGEHVVAVRDGPAKVLELHFAQLHSGKHSKTIPSSIHSCKGTLREVLQPPFAELQSDLAERSQEGLGKEVGSAWEGDGGREQSKEGPRAIRREASRNSFSMSRYCFSAAQWAEGHAGSLRGHIAELHGKKHSRQQCTTGQRRGPEGRRSCSNSPQN